VHRHAGLGPASDRVIRPLSVRLAWWLGHASIQLVGHRSGSASYSDQGSSRPGQATRVNGQLLGKSAPYDPLQHLVQAAGHLTGWTHRAAAASNPCFWEGTMYTEPSYTRSSGHMTA
jgi:hypothetical protein